MSAWRRRRRTRSGDSGSREAVLTLRNAVNPLRYASRKPRVSVLGCPFGACVSPMEAPGETSLFRAVRHMTMSFDQEK